MTSPNAGPAARLLAWERFLALLSEPDGLAEVGTPELVEALINRDALEHDVARGTVDHERVARADADYRTVARAARGKTQMALFATNKPASAWWWHAGADVAPSEDVLNIPRTAELKGVHENTVRAAIGRGELPARRLGRGFLIQRADALAWRPRRVGRPERANPRDSVLVDFALAIKNRDRDGADDAVARAKRDPSTGDRAAVVAHALFAEGADHEVLEWIGRARGAGVTDVVEPSLGVLQGLVLARLGATDAAIDLLRKAVDARPDAPGPLAGLATVLWNAGSPDEARSLLEDAIARLDDAGELEFMLAERLFREGHLGQAMRHITRFRENHPMHLESAVLEGAILGQLGDQTEDKLAYEQALALFEESPLPESKQFLAITLARLGRWEEALNAAVSLDAEAQSLIVRGALLSALRGDGLEAAYAAARLVLDRIGASPLAQSLLALEQSAADPEAARALLNHAIGPYRSDDDAAIATVAWIAAGQPGPAVSQLQNLIAQDEVTPTRLILLAQAAVAAHFDDDAMKALTRLATLNDSHAVSRQNVSHVAAAGRR